MANANAVQLVPAIALLAPAVFIVQPAFAQPAVCPEPGEGARAPSTAGSTSGSTAAQRLRDRNPLVREMARADVLNDEGRREEAAAIYRKLAGARPDRRQTARRAQLRLAQVALAARDFAAAENSVQLAVAGRAPADIQSRAQRLRTQIAYRRQIAAAETELEQVDALVTAGNLDAATGATQRLLARACPYPPDYPARVKTRLARIYRAKGDFATARATALDAQASAQTPSIRQGTQELIAEIDAAALAAQLRGTITQANARIDSGDSPGAIALLEPLVARPGLPPEIDANARLRLARAYAQAERFDDAIATLDPLLARAPGTEPALTPEDFEAVSRIRLARANNLQTRGLYPQSGAAYRQLLASEPPVVPEVRDSARLGLARALERQGDRSGALEQVALVRADPASPRLLERADSLLSDIQGGVPMNRLVGSIETGIAYETNVPTRVSAVEDDSDDELGFPGNQRFEDWHGRIEARLQYRHQLNDDGDYLDLSAAGLRTFQFDLTELDRSRVELRAGPVLASAGGSTEFLLGGEFDVEWRGSNFRSSEPGLYVGIRQRLGIRSSATATYTIGWHNDYIDQRDGVHHSVELALRHEASDADVLRAVVRGTREGAELDRYRNWRLRGGLSWTHRWPARGNIEPFVELGGDAERVFYDGLTSGIKRRDWRLRANAEAGIDIGRSWRASANYGFYDINSNVPNSRRLPNHQVGLNLRFSWN